MANTKRTTSKTNTKAVNDTIQSAETTEITKTVNAVENESTTADILSVINDNVDKVSNTDNVKATSRTTEVTIANEEEIAVRSIVFGGLTWISPRTNAHYRWNEIGSVEYIPFGELITMNNTKRQYLFNPLVIVQDERAVKHFRLQPVYEKVAQINSLEKVFNSSNRNEVEKVLKTILDVNMRDVAISRIRAMRQNGTLTNIDVIHMIEKILCFDLSSED